MLQVTEKIEKVSSFIYLSSIISSSGDTKKDVICRNNKDIGEIQSRRSAGQALSVTRKIKFHHSNNNNQLFKRYLY